MEEIRSPYGTKYVGTGEVTGPDGRTRRLTTVWFDEPGDTRPRLATAYPS